MIASNLYADDATNSFKKLLMPGAVVNAHAEYEHECSNCHAELSNTTQQKLCLDCHEDISSDIQKIRGLHGKQKSSSNGECRNCHTEHLGRQGNIIKFDQDTFDHELTDFALLGKHASQACSHCHEINTAYRDTPHECFTCHQDKDRHAGNFGEQCDDCHDSSAWDKHQFDHGDTKFSLKGKHQNGTIYDYCRFNRRSR